MHSGYVAMKLFFLSISQITGRWEKVQADIAPQQSDSACCDLLHFISQCLVRKIFPVHIIPLSDWLESTSLFRAYFLCEWHMYVDAHACMNLRCICFLSTLKDALIKATDYSYIIKDISKTKDMYK